MVRLSFLVAAIAIAGYYFYKIEKAAIFNNLTCLYSAPGLGEINQNYLARYKKKLPERFPSARFDYLASAVAVSDKTKEEPICDSINNNEFTNSFLYEEKIKLYPLFPEINIVFNSIQASQRRKEIGLMQIARLKATLDREIYLFHNFSQDCIRIRELVDQITLMEAHLKINKISRKPTAAKDSFRESHMIKNISRQLDFARRHLVENKKLFLSKWVMFFKYGSEKSLCSY